MFRLTPLIALLSLMPATLVQAQQKVRWWDGTVAEAPAGSLLSDNDRFWGNAIETGVTYEYETQPDAPADIRRRDADTFGNRLLDGNGMRPPTPESWMNVQETWGDPYLRVGKTDGPLIIVFDFKQVRTFTEIDLLSENKRISLAIEARNTEDEPWQQIASQPMEDTDAWQMRRVRLTPAVDARYVRVQVQADAGVTYLNQVFAWGHSELEPAPVPAAYQSPVQPRNMETISAVSIPGIDATAFASAEFRSWKQSLRAHAKQPAVWADVATWDRISNEPILPEGKQLLRRVQIEMARNETEPRAIALVNTDWQQPLETRVSLSAFRLQDSDSEQTAVKGRVRVAGAINSRTYGVNVGPLFAPDDLLPEHLMRKYLTNGYGIAKFPELVLSPAGAAVLWLDVETDGAAPGIYEATLSAGENVTLPIRVHVLDVTLPAEKAWVHSWSATTKMFPFEPTDRLVNEVDYKQTLGISVWKGLPEPGTANALARERGHAIFYDYIVPWKYVEGVWTSKLKADQLGSDDAREIATHIQKMVDRANELGLSYDDWFGEITDEPRLKNVEVFGKVAQLVKSANPDLLLYCNPCFWVGGGVSDDAQVYAALKDWYNDTIDISVPLTWLLDHEKSYSLYDSKRKVNGFYNVISQHAKSERARHIVYYRSLPWEAMVRGWNGWGIYSYHRPRGSAWDDFDRDLRSNENAADYLIVYPGPRGPIPTRQSEAMRQGWEDYRLMQLLLRSPQAAKAQALLKQYEQGEDMADLRRQALHLAAELQAE